MARFATRDIIGLRGTQALKDAIMNDKEAFLHGRRNSDLVNYCLVCLLEAGKPMNWEDAEDLLYKQYRDLKEKLTQYQSAAMSTYDEEQTIDYVAQTYCGCDNEQLIGLLVHQTYEVK